MRIHDESHVLLRRGLLLLPVLLLHEPLAQTDAVNRPHRPRAPRRGHHAQPQRLTLNAAHLPLLNMSRPEAQRVEGAPDRPPCRPSTIGGNSSEFHVVDEEAEPPPLFSPEPLEWLWEAVAAEQAYKEPPDFIHLHRVPELTPLEIVVNTSVIPTFPASSLVVTTGSVIHSITPRWYRVFSNNIVELLKLLPPEYMDKPFMTWYNDFHHPLPFPMLTGPRVIGDENNVLITVQYERHFQSTLSNLPPDSVPWEEKVPRAIWRGMDSGGLYLPNTTDARNHRHVLVSRWGNCTHPHIDVAFAGTDVFDQEHMPHWASAVSIEEQRRYRYLINVEGQDVASGIAWMLDSHSVVLSVPPRREFWGLEAQLQPWVHYVPLRDDYADLWDRMQLCEKYLKRCKDISQRATDFVQWFKDHKRSKQLAAAKVKAYLDMVTVVVTS